MKDIIIKQLTNNEFEEMQISSWPIWEKEVSKFPWIYEQTEQCWIIEGEVEIHANEKRYSIKANDFVVFPKDLACIWDIKKDIIKHYNFI